MLDGTKTKAMPRKLFSTKIAISLDKSLNGRGHYYIFLQEELETACSRDLECTNVQHLDQPCCSTSSLTAAYSHLVLLYSRGLICCLFAAVTCKSVPSLDSRPIKIRPGTYCMVNSAHACVTESGESPFFFLIYFLSLYIQLSSLLRCSRKLSH